MGHSAGGAPSTVVARRDNLRGTTPVDAFLVIVIVTSFAALATSHVALVAGLAWRRPRLRGLLSLLVPPAAPYFGVRERMWVRSVLWALSLVVYLVARIVATRFR
ncbi:MAG TPA: hypothetical protein VHC69_17205 [Polyangiaceae bacterium]|nr:hypothetical protein [Polyangiaceae bacterium]